MWMIVMRGPRASHPYWPGRRVLGAIDAVAWPALACAATLQVPSLVSTIVGQLLVAVLVLMAGRRFALAVWRNERFSFVTTRVMHLAFVLAMTGLVIKLVAALQ